MKAYNLNRALRFLGPIKSTPWGTYVRSSINKFRLFDCIRGFDWCILPPFTLEYVRTYIHVDWAGVAISTTRGYGYEDRVVCVVWGVWGAEGYYDE